MCPEEFVSIVERENINLDSEVYKTPEENLSDRTLRGYEDNLLNNERGHVCLPIDSYKFESVYVDNNFVRTLMTWGYLLVPFIMTIILFSKIPIAFLLGSIYLFMTVSYMEYKKEAFIEKGFIRLFKGISLLWLSISLSFLLLKLLGL